MKIYEIVSSAMLTLVVVVLIAIQSIEPDKTETRLFIDDYWWLVLLSVPALILIARGEQK